MTASEPTASSILRARFVMRVVRNAYEGYRDVVEFTDAERDALADLLDAIPPGWNFKSESDLWDVMAGILSARDTLEAAIRRGPR